MDYSKEEINPYPGVGSDADSEHSCPGMAVESPRPEATRDESSSLNVFIREHNDMDDGAIPATPGGTGAPDSMDAHPVDLATVTEPSDLLRGQVQESIPWDLSQQRPLLSYYTKEDWVQKQDEDVVLHRLKHLMKSGGLASVGEGIEIPELT